ncbi:Protein YcgL [invertebrate metagenome]|uniref:Protein YcgL n=1 Tax=invertebrate metagenome TaxID=1711999 RepID=A0A2H9T5F3_9ZZZZ
MKKHIVSVYKTLVREGVYLYVDKKDQLSKVPEELLKRFHHTEHVMDILLTSRKKLARADSSSVMDAIDQKGFYLQMPPAEEEYIKHLPDHLLTFNDPV